MGLWGRLWDSFGEDREKDNLIKELTKKDSPKGLDESLSYSIMILS